MSFINTDYSNNSHQDYSALPQGNYEMVIKSAKETTTKNGSESLQLDLVVRNDLDQVPELKETNANYHNRHVFMDNWKRKATGQYDMEGFQYILEGAQVPEGTAINTVEDFMRLISGRPILVFVKKEKDTYKDDGSYRNTVAPWNISKTKFTQVNHVYKDQKDGQNPFASQQPAQNADPFAGQGQTIDIQSSDLPF